MPKQVQVFLSHINEEAEVAKTISDALQSDFLNLIRVFVSSDDQSIWVGDDFPGAIKDALGKSDLFMVLCSPASIDRPWINIEAGAAWIREIPLVPLCYSGLRPGNLPTQFWYRQAVDLERPNGLVPLYKRITDIIRRVLDIPLEPPRPSIDDLTIRLAADESTIKADAGKLRERGAKASSRPRPLRSLEEILSMVVNKALRDFVRTEVANGLPFRGKARLLYPFGGRTINFNITRKWTTIWQPFRFRDDINFWTSRLGKDAQVKEVSDGACLTFKLITPDHFKKFKKAVDDGIPPE